MAMRTVSPVLATVLLMLGITWAAADEPAVSAILTSSRSRAAYLAHATIWTDPGDLSSDQILAGPRDVFPYSAAAALEGIGCTFVKPGRELGGKSAKFLCGTSDGRTLRLKYWDPERETGNREVFATVAATRLMWALGFEVLHALPVNVRCHECPGNPMTGEGARSDRDYVAEMSVYPPSGPRILSRDDPDQGWSWRELHDAIEALPPGPERTRQRTYFDALTLLGVLMQHGDRKPEQQLLYCDAPVESDQQRAGRHVAVASGPRAAASRDGMAHAGDVEHACGQPDPARVHRQPDRARRRAPARHDDHLHAVPARRVAGDALHVGLRHLVVILIATHGVAVAHDSHAGRAGREH